MDKKVIEGLKKRAQRIAHIWKHHLSGYNAGKGNYFNDFKRSNLENPTHTIPTSGTIRFNFNDSAWIEFTGIQPKNVTKQKLHEPVVLGSEKLDVSTSVIENASNCDVEECYTYSKEESKTVVQDVGVEVSVGISQTIGYEGAVVSGETEFSLDVSSSYSKGWENSETKSQESTRTITVPPMTKATVTQQLFKGSYSQKAEYWADLEHGITLTSDKDFQHKWSSFSQFIDTIKGNSPNDVSMGDVFRKFPWGKPEITAKPINVHYTTNVTFDQATTGDLKITSNEILQ